MWIFCTSAASIQWLARRAISACAELFGELQTLGTNSVPFGSQKKFSSPGTPICSIFGLVYPGFVPTLIKCGGQKFYLYIGYEKMASVWGSARIPLGNSRRSSSSRSSSRTPCDSCLRRSSRIAVPKFRSPYFTVKQRVPETAATSRIKLQLTKKPSL